MSNERVKKALQIIADEKQEVEKGLEKWHEKALALVEKYHDLPDGASFIVGYSPVVSVHTFLGWLKRESEYDGLMEQVHYWREYFKSKNEGYSDKISVSASYSKNIHVGYIGKDTGIAFYVDDSLAHLFLSEGCEIVEEEGMRERKIVCKNKGGESER